MPLENGTEFIASEKTPEFIKTPLARSIDWDDFPPETKGRVILKLWPANEMSGGGIVLPGATGRRVLGVAWVYRAYGEAGNHLHPGDSVICPQNAIGAGLQFPDDGKEPLKDYVEIDARDVYHVLRLDRAIEWREQARQDFAAKFEDAEPKILLLAGEGEKEQALGWIKALNGEAVMCDSPLLKSSFPALDARVIQIVAEVTSRKEAEKAAQNEKAKADLAAERQRIVDQKQGKVS